MQWLIAALFGAFGGWLADFFGAGEGEVTPAPIVAVAGIEEVATSAAELVVDGTLDTCIPLMPSLRHSGTAQRTVPAWELNTLWPGVC